MKVSIIIPAYNVENYIYRGLDSCINQTYSDIEIIVVDDGSSDNTYSIAKKYSESDSRVKLYRQKNSGVSAARNFGLNVCTSDYVLFLDSDDWLELNTVEEMVNHLPKNNEDCLVSAETTYCHIDKNEIKKEKLSTIMKKTEMNAEDALLYFEGKPYKLQCCSYKLFSMKVIHENALRFDETIHHGEDGLFVFEYLKRVRKFVYFPESLWNVLKRPGSATRSPYNSSFLSAVKAVDKMLAYDNSNKLNVILKHYRMQRIRGVLALASTSKKPVNDDIRYLRKELKHGYKEYMINEKSIKNKLSCSFLTFFPIKFISLYYDIRKRYIR
jgi:glycosyltransferase involved in cell wall biosynthesis